MKSEEVILLVGLIIFVCGLLHLIIWSSVVDSNMDYFCQEQGFYKHSYNEETNLPYCEDALSVSNRGIVCKGFWRDDCHWEGIANKEVIEVRR